MPEPTHTSTARDEAAPPRGAADDPTLPSRSRLLRVVTDPWVRLGILLTIVGAVVAITLTGDTVTAEGLRARVDGLGAAAPVVYIVLYGLATTFLIPAAPFTIAAGLLFGAVPGTVIALTGATLGATGAFLLGRMLGREAARQLGGRQVARIDAFLADRGFVAVVVLRLVPLFPYNVINVSAGVTGIRLREYVLATAIGIIPGTVVYVALGGTVTDPTSPTFLGALAAFAVLTVGAGYAARRMHSQEPALETAQDDAGSS